MSHYIYNGCGSNYKQLGTTIYFIDGLSVYHYNCVCMRRTTHVFILYQQFYDPFYSFIMFI